MLKVYLSGEIHTNWRDEIINKCKDLNLNITFYSPVTDHELSDDVGIKILGNEEKKFWHDNKSAKINAIKHALKEVYAAALAVTKNTDEVVQILKYTLNGNI